MYSCAFFLFVLFLTLVSIALSDSSGNKSISTQRSNSNPVLSANESNKYRRTAADQLASRDGRGRGWTGNSTLTFTPPDDDGPEFSVIWSQESPTERSVQARLDGLIGPASETLAPQVLAPSSAAATATAPQIAIRASRFGTNHSTSLNNVSNSTGTSASAAPGNAVVKKDRVRELLDLISTSSSTETGQDLGRSYEVQKMLPEAGVEALPAAHNYLNANVRAEAIVTECDEHSSIREECGVIQPATHSKNSISITTEKQKSTVVSAIVVPSIAVPAEAVQIPDTVEHVVQDQASIQRVEPSLTESQLDRLLLEDFEKIEEQLRQQIVQAVSTAPSSTQATTKTPVHVIAPDSAPPSNSAPSKTQIPLPLPLSVPLQPLHSVPFASITSSARNTIQGDNGMTCIRLIALEVLDDPRRRIKTIHAFKPVAPLADLNSSSSRDYSSTLNTNIFQNPESNASAQIFAVRLCDDWYETTIVGGDVFHVTDLCEIDLQNNESQVASTTGGGPQRNVRNVARAMSCFALPPQAQNAANIAGQSHSGNYQVLAVIDNQRGVCIVHPDIMVTPTRISEAVSCERRAVLTERGTAGGVSGEAATLGSVKHSFIEEILTAGFRQMQKQGAHRRSQSPQFDAATIDAMIFRCIQEHAEEVACLPSSVYTDKSIYTELMALIPPVAHFIRTTFDYTPQQSVAQSATGPEISSTGGQLNGRSTASLAPSAQAAAGRAGPNGSTGAGSGTAPADYVVRDVASIEESITCPALGIKGQVDAVLVARLISCALETTSSTKQHMRLLPLELKTGKRSSFTGVSHRAQVILYILMLIIRGSSSIQQALDALTLQSNEDTIGKSDVKHAFPSPPLHGLLCYIGADTCVVETITPSWPEVRALLHIRNELAGNLARALAAGGFAAGTTLPTVASRGAAHRDHMGSATIGSAALRRATGSVVRALPPMRKDRECEYCYQATECFNTHLAMEGGDAQSSGVPVLFDYVTGKISASNLSNTSKGLDASHPSVIALSTLSAHPRHAAYLRYWDAVLSLESKAAPSSMHAWTASAQQRKDAGDKSLGRLRLQACLTEHEWARWSREDGASPAIPTDTNRIGPSPTPHSVSQSKFLVFEHHSALSRKFNKTDNISTNEVTSTTRASVDEDWERNVPFSPGDRVSVSLETIHPEPSALPPASSIAANVQVFGAAPARDIEDIVPNMSRDPMVQRPSDPHVSVALPHAANRIASGHPIGSVSSHSKSMQSTRRPWSVLDVEPALVMGVVVDISPKRIVLAVDSVPARFGFLASFAAKMALPTSGSQAVVTCRLDRDDANSVTSRTLRSNLYTLLMRPFRPMEFKEFKAQQTSLSGASNMVGLGSRVQNVQANVELQDTSLDLLARLRGLVVDLHAPRFMSSSALGIGVHMFCPPGFPLQSYKASMKHLGAHTRTMATSLAPAASETVVSSAFPIQCGPHGELHILGGLTVLPGCNPLQLYREFLQLNADQKEAIRRILLAQDYSLVLGMPGSGKTSALALAVRVLLARGERVLLTSYTHAALDHLLTKIVQAGLPPAFVLRLGSPASVDSDLHPYLLDADAVVDPALSKGKSNGDVAAVQREHGRVEAMGNTILSLRRRCDEARLVACTALTAPRSAVVRYIVNQKRSGISSGRHPTAAAASGFKEDVTTGFDWCILDEAGQVSQPAALGPLMQASRFVLVGDEYQLPPLVVSTEALARGADVSLFKRLSEAHPNAVSCLTQQYRMCDDVMSLCNVLIYSHRMKCAGPEVARARMRLPALNLLPLPLHSSRLQNPIPSMAIKIPTNPAENPPIPRTDWLFCALRASPAVVMLNTDAVVLPLDMLQTAVSYQIDGTSGSGTSTGRIRNEIEAALVLLLVRGLATAGLYDFSELGIASPFRAQVSLLQQTLAGSVKDFQHLESTAPAIVAENPRSVFTKSAKSPDLSQIEVSTVDRFQGRDKDIIVLSTVRSLALPKRGPGNPTAAGFKSSELPENNEGSAGDLLRDWRRINVAITRAKKKLIILGSPTIMRQVPVLDALVELVQQRGWMMNLPADALTMYGCKSKE